MIAPPRSSGRDVETLPRSGEASARQWPLHILIGIDGLSSSDDAITSAIALAGRHSDAVVETVTVYVPHTSPPLSGLWRGSAEVEGSERNAVAALLQSIRRQRRQWPRARRNWPTRLEVGDPSSVILRLANDVGADLVIIGIGQAQPGDRHFGDHTSLRIAQYLDVPLYAAAPHCEPVTCCIVALPDGRIHEPTLRAAVSCLPAGGTLVMVQPDETTSGGLASRSDVRDAVRAVCGTELGLHLATLDLDRVSVSGDVFTAVLRIADDTPAQLIAVPNRGDSPVRAFLPNLTDPMLLAARCSVLAVPD